MFLIKPIIEGAAVVLRGSFNPAIIQPGWLARYELIGETEARNAEVTLIHPELTGIELDHFNISVQPDNFTVASKDIHFDLVRDFILTAFGKFLPHTPVTMTGINRMVHFDCGSFELRDKVGEHLAPKEAWGEWGSMLTGDPEATKEHGGMTSLSMRQAKRNDNYKGWIEAVVQPSVRAPLTGIYMGINDHYDFTPNNAQDSSLMVEVLESQWVPSLRRAEFIVNQIMSLVLRIRDHGNG